ncbi:PREDICTED: abl interactor 2 [Ceratosolen solmsi marchali]|uniref:Abl interactor 2 n=1 Tax=Ceratosolen solmsi marchali TaxID=326594 RepID=A0AAJ6YT96_9HYME|nr:PREDICTED: abl interactor 2 [Ceratosolen solmsi marchali]
MAELATLLHQEIPEGRHNLSDSHTNLERVADYCEANYFQADNKRIALEETKNYTTQSLASVAYQINTLAYNFLQLLDLQSSQLSEMESQMNHISQTVMIHKEKVARREIGVLTANKMTSRQYKIIAPANPEKPIKYVRKNIDYTIFDDIGHGVRGTETPRIKQRGGSQSSVQSLGASSTGSGLISNIVGPAPTTKPPTPPQVGRTGTLNKSSKEYRTPPAVAPPQVPSHYAPNYPLGHPRRERGPGYSTLPMHIHTTHSNNSNIILSHPLQVGTVHPLQNHIQSSTATVQNLNSIQIGISYNQEHHINMPPPPSPLTANSEVLDYSGHNTLPHRFPHQYNCSGTGSPPLPPPPSDHEELSQFGRLVSCTGTIRPIVPEEEDLPGWVPKNYIEKVIAIYDYYADKEDELSFQESSVIYVLKKNDDGWWEGVMEGITGLFPGNYVEHCV